MADRALAAIVLAGGRSRRMGRDKAALTIEGEALVVRVVRAVSSVCDPVILVAAPTQVLPALPPCARVVRDPSAFEGPLAGLLAGLDAIAGGRATQAFVVGVDAVRLTPELVRAMASLAPDEAAVAFDDGERLQPLPAILPVARARQIASELVGRGERRLRVLVAALAPVALTRGQLLADDALRAVDAALLGLDDADDPAALARLLR